MSYSLDGGRILIDAHRDGFWHGRTREGREVVAAIKAHRDVAGLEALFSYDVPGIAPLVFVGRVDVEDDDDDDEADDDDDVPAPIPEVAVVEARPRGVSIAHAPAFDERATIRLGVDLCAMAIAWSERRDDLTSGIRPETVYVEDQRFTGATPRVELFQGRHSDHFEAPATGLGSYTADDVGFVIARILWIALLREDPYRLPDAPNDLENIWHDRRRPWTGPRALGDLLERVLVADDRVSVRDFGEALRRMTS
jgi:hypothetical protein